MGGTGLTVWGDYKRGGYDPPPSGITNALVGTTVGVISVSFPSVEFGGAFFSLFVQIKLFLDSMIRGRGWYFRDVDYCPATFCPFL